MSRASVYSNSFVRGRFVAQERRLGYVDYSIYLLSNNCYTVLFHSYTKNIHIKFENVFQFFKELEHTLLHQYMNSYYSKIYYFQWRTLINLINNKFQWNMNDETFYDFYGVSFSGFRQFEYLKQHILKWLHCNYGNDKFRTGYISTQSLLIISHVSGA